MYPDARVETILREQFIPVKIHIKEQPRVFQRFGAQWTPTIVIVDDGGNERHRFEGFLPADDFLAQLELGLGKLAFAHEEWSTAEQRFRQAAERYPDSEAAPEALYWAGVANYKGSGDASALGETARAFQKRYQQSSWAKRASVWAA